MDKKEVVCIGQALVDCITGNPVPHKPRVYRAQSISLNTGGDALNEASVLARAGAAVRLVCGLGEDAAGDLVLETAKKRGIDISGISRIRELTTPVANLMVAADGSRVSYNSPATMLEGYLPEAEVMKGAAVVSLASAFRAPLDQAETLKKLITGAKEVGAVLCMDTKLPTYREIGLSDIAEVLPLVDYIFPNESEAAFFTGEEDPMEAARRIREMGVRNVIVKTGEKGCCVCGEKESFELPALSVPAVDSTGAGDHFVAGFILGILEEGDLTECCRRGRKLAAECVQHAGAFA